MKRDKPPPPIVRLSNGLHPVTAYDAEALGAYPQGTEFDLIARTKRSLPHLATYWRTLHNVVAATGRWPTPEALHTALKIRLGRFEPTYDLAGKINGMRPESVAFDAMTQAEFRIYFDQAMQALGEAIGADPLEWMEE